MLGQCPEWFQQTGALVLHLSAGAGVNQRPLLPLASRRSRRPRRGVARMFDESALLYLGGVDLLVALVADVHPHLRSVASVEFRAFFVARSGWPGVWPKWWFKWFRRPPPAQVSANGVIQSFGQPSNLRHTLGDDFDPVSYAVFMSLQAGMRHSQGGSWGQVHFIVVWNVWTRAECCFSFLHARETLPMEGTWM